MRRIILSILMVFFFIAHARGGDGFLFVTFRGEQTPMTEQIYFAISDDGKNWTALNNGEPTLVSQIGEKGVRDPYLVRARDNSKFFLIATDLSINLNHSWKRASQAGSHSIVIWESNDLVHWSEPRLAPISADDAGCTWAPEAIFDEDAKDYLVYWASLNKSDEFKKFRIWACHTSDFKTFGKPFVYLDKPDSTIDTDIVRDGNKYYRFSKNDKHKTIIQEVSEKLSGPWTDVSDISLDKLQGYEGPACFQMKAATADQPATWCLLIDHFAKGLGYEPFITHDLASGSFEAAGDITFPFKFRHGAVLPVTAEEMDRLKLAYVKPATQEASKKIITKEHE